MRPLVSVMMPCYDSAHTLALALTSLREQTCEDWELVLVDDGSHDEPESIVRALGDPRIRFTRFAQNRGRGVARQHALSEARGEFLCMLDADDWYYPTKLERQLALLAAEPEVGIVSTAVVVTDERGALVGVRPKATAENVSFARFRGAGLSPIPSNPCMTRMHLAKSVSFDPTLGRSQDTDWLLRVLRQTTYAFDPTPSYAYAEPAERFAPKVWASARCTAKSLWKQRSVGRAGTLWVLATVLAKATLTSGLHHAGLARALASRRSREATPSEAREYADTLAMLRRKTECLQGQESARACECEAFA